MKKFLIILASIIIGSVASAQSPFPEPSQIEYFYSTKTLVVLESQMFSTYNAFIKGAMKEYWDITEYEFITSDEFETKRKDPQYSFIVLTETKFDKDKSGSVYNFINLLLGTRVGRIEDMPEMCAIPLSIANTDEFDYTFKVGMVLRFMQAHVKHLSEDPSIKGKKYLKYYNQFIPELPDKTILVSADDLEEDVLSQKTNPKIFPQNLKILTEEEVNAAIVSRSENSVILHKVGPEGGSGGICFKMLIGTDNGMMYFYGEHTITPKNKNGLLVNDIKRIGRF
jgi:hypothetical protein